jgi:formylglycine-generating enzyme required for sulfatase activity
VTSAPDLARIPAGDFLMGAADAEDDERPVHRVFVSEFYIARYAVSHDDYARFIRETGYPPPSVRGLPLVANGERDTMFRELAAPYEWEGPLPPQGRGNHPVVLVRFDDAVSYCEWLSAVIDRRVRLPTEAEWEKAARGGVEGRRYPWGDTVDETCANFLVDPSAKARRGTRPGGTYAPNGFGLYDVIGNVWEWVSDWYARDYYGQGEPRDPRGPASGQMRIVRGGSWVNEEQSKLRCACRHTVPPDTYAYSIGFRVVCEP